MDSAFIAFDHCDSGDYRESDDCSESGESGEYFWGWRIVEFILKLSKICSLFWFWSKRYKGDRLTYESRAVFCSGRRKQVFYHSLFSETLLVTF